MSDDLTMRAPSHYLRVDLRDPAEAEYWLVVLDAPRRQIEEALASVGPDALDVAAYLRQGRGSPAASPTQHGPCVR